VKARRALTAALDCPVQPLVRLVYQVTVPQNLQTLMQNPWASVPDNPGLHECLPLLTAICPLPPAMWHQLLHLWQAMVQLVRETASRDPYDPSAPTRTEAYATPPVTNPGNATRGRYTRGTPWSVLHV
jgi:hypothetical protein